MAKIWFELQLEVPRARRFLEGLNAICSLGQLCCQSDASKLQIHIVSSGSGLQLCNQNVSTLHCISNCWGSEVNIRGFKASRGFELNPCSSCRTVICQSFPLRCDFVLVSTDVTLVSTDIALVSDPQRKLTESWEAELATCQGCTFHWSFKTNLFVIF